MQSDLNNVKAYKKEPKNKKKRILAKHCRLIKEKLKDMVYTIHICIEYDNQTYDKPFFINVSEKKNDISVFINFEGFFKLITPTRNLDVLHNSKESSEEYSVISHSSTNERSSTLRNNYSTNQKKPKNMKRHARPLFINSKKPKFGNR